jgi:hypothetical protein
MPAIRQITPALRIAMLILFALTAVAVALVSMRHGGTAHVGAAAAHMKPSYFLYA